MISYKYNKLIIMPIFMIIFYEIGMLFKIPQFLSFLFIISIFIIFFISLNKQYLLKRELKTFFIIVSIAFIDKFNDFIFSLNFKHLISFLFSVFLVYFLLIISRSKYLSYKAWLYVRNSILFTIVIGFSYYKFNGVYFPDIIRDLSFLILFLTMMLYCHKKRMYFLLLPFIFYFLFFITEARTQVASLLLFIILSILFRNEKTKKTLLFYLFLAFIGMFSVIY